ncbi:MAG: aminotransferase class I/II-fold pyridoxal phosphate-dependent enzyme [Clostridiales bacterium]|jgi:aminotransferase|nr:aminotransferase class I/II-fold pyridoxal phosphate-dependent enzyme [Clostridiales bacterium]
MDCGRFINKTVRDLKPSGIRKFFDIVAQMPDALSLGVGEPDFVTPWEIRDAAIKSVQKGYTAYTSNRGLLALREETAAFLKERYGVKYDPAEEILITIGASEAIDLTLRAVIEPGDGVIVPEPSYVSYMPAVALAGGVSQSIKTTADDGFKLTAEAVEKAVTKNTKAIILPYPNNPTGAVMTGRELEAVAPVIKKHDLLVLSDEIYAELSYGAPHTSIASLKDMRERTALLSGFSKAFAMTGWRVGYVAAPRELLSAMVKVHQYTIMCAPTVSQYAALAALQTGRRSEFAAVAEMREKYDMRRRFMFKAFNDMGLKCFEPNGAFYVFPSVESTGMDGEEFARKLLEQKKVAVVPGGAFGESTKNFIRCSYASGMPTLSEAVDRIADFIGATS